MSKRRGKKVKIGLDINSEIKIEVVPTITGTTILIIKSNDGKSFWMDKEDAYEFTRRLQSAITEM